MTRFASAIGSATLAILLLFPIAGNAQSEAEPEAPTSTASLRLVDSVAAQVGTDIVLASEVMEMAAPVESRMREAGAPPEQILQVRREALERLIETRLLSSVVERLELGATRQEIDQAINAIALDNGLSLEQLIASITSHGLSVEEYREKIRDEIERSKVVNAMVRSRVQIAEEEVIALYEEEFGDQRDGGEEVHVRHIIVMTQGPVERSTAAACLIADEARARIDLGGEDFGQVASRVSDSGAERGGDLGWMHREELAPWMWEAIQNLQPGEVTDVLSMPFGCSVLQVVDRREFTPVEYAQAEPQLRALLFQRKTEEEYVKWVEVLRKQTYIERKGTFAADGALGS